MSFANLVLFNMGNKIKLKRYLKTYLDFLNVLHIFK